MHSNDPRDLSAENYSMTFAQVLNSPETVLSYLPAFKLAYLAISHFSAAQQPQMIHA